MTRRWLYRTSYLHHESPVTCNFFASGWFSVVDDCNDNVIEWTSVSDIDFGATKAVLPCTSVPCLAPSSRSAKGSRSFSRSQCAAGEVLTLGDRYVERTTQSNGCCCLFPSKSASKRITEVDYAIARNANGVDLLLPMTSKGRFMKVGRVLPGGELEAGAAYRMSDLITSVSLPCVVRLVYGRAPSGTSSFGGLLRLEEAFREETVIACALASPKFKLLEFPLDSDIRFRPATNNEHLLGSSHLQGALEFCLEKVLPYIVSLKVIQNFYTEEQTDLKDEKNFDPLTSLSPKHVMVEEKTSVQAEVTDTETVRSNDTSHYETIPFDRQHHDVIRTPVDVRRSTPDDTYLLPVQNALYSNVSEVRHSLPRHGSAGRADVMSEGTVLGRLPASGTERMNRFLQDSLEELSRTRVAPDADVTARSDTVQDKLDAFLDSIFDCDTLESQEDTRDVTPHNCYDEQQQHVTSLRPPLLRSLSDVHVKSQPMSLYISSAKSDQAPATTHDTLGMTVARDVTSDVNDSGSSSRSVSEIYRQMKLVGDPLDQQVRASPYARTDSGIVMARHTALSSSSSQTLYPALSDASWRPPDVIDALSVEEVTLALLYIGLKRDSVELFAAQQIDGRQLQELDDQLLTAGFPQLNALERKKVLDFRNGWRPKKLEF